MNVNQPCEPAAAGAPKNRRLFGLYPWLAALAVVLLWGTPARAVETSVGLINMLENNSGYTPWEWDVSDGAVFTGVYAWSCGDIIAGEALFQGGGGDLDITPGKDYTCTLKDLGASIGYPSDQICYAAGAISPPGCYDIYICDPPATNGFVRSYGYPNWVGGYMYGYTVSTNPNCYELFSDRKTGLMLSAQKC